MGLSEKYWRLLCLYPRERVFQHVKLCTRATVSKLFQPRNIAPRTAEEKTQKASSKSQKLMVDCGIVYPAGTGTFCLLPLGERILRKLTNLIDHEMHRIGAQKLLLPVLTSGRLWKTTGRWDEAGPELFKLCDRHKKEYVLCPTQEEAITDLVASVNLSGSMLPLRLYQISNKFRDEKRPRFGLLRSREFLMKDMYTFDITTEDAQRTYDEVCAAYDNIFRKIGVRYVKVLGDSGLMGGSVSHEYHFLTDIGEDHIVLCPNCNYGVNKAAVTGGDAPQQCPQCSHGQLESHNGIEVGHTFLLGAKYSSVLKATVKYHDVDWPFEMGCYGIGLTRIMAAAVECLSSSEEIRWPLVIAPYKVCIITPKKGSKEARCAHLADELYVSMNSIPLLKGEVIIHDRDDWTIGKRLQDARKTGYPFIIVVGKKAMPEEPQFELYNVAENQNFVFSSSDIIKYFQSNFSQDI